MLFVLQVLRILPALMFNNSSIIILTPNGREELLLQAGETVKIHSPDFHTVLSFTYRRRTVFYPLLQLLEKPRINFAPTPLSVEFGVYRKVQSDDQHLRVVGHRGSGSDAYRKSQGLPYVPENSVESFQLAHKLGTNWVELDLLITADDEIVCFHDYKVGDKPVWEMTFEQFKSNVNAPTTFEELFHKLEKSINLALEIKYPSTDEIRDEKLGNAPDLEHFMDRIISIIRKWKNRVIILSSFEPNVLIYAKKTAPELAVFYLTEGVPDKFSDPRRNSIEEGVKFCLENDFQGIATDSEVITCDPLRQTAAFHSHGLEIMIYFWRALFKKVDIAREIARFECAGVDGVMADDIEMVNQIVTNASRCYYNSDNMIESNEIEPWSRCEASRSWYSQQRFLPRSMKKKILL